jgi:hypothetical protein
MRQASLTFSLIRTTAHLSTEHCMDLLTCCRRFCFIILFRSNVFVSARKSNEVMPRTTQADQRCSTMSPTVARSRTSNLTPSPSRSLDNSVDQQLNFLQSPSPSTNKRKRILSVSQGGNSFDDTENIEDINNELKQLKRMIAKVYTLQKRATIKEVMPISRTIDTTVHE